MTIRPAKPSDREAIAAIQVASPEASHWDPTGYECWVAEDDGLCVGFVAARANAPDESEILNLAVAPAWRRRGVARALVRHAVKVRPGGWFLEVRASNGVAQRLYEGVGFRRVGMRENYYHEPTEAAIVMGLQS